MALRELHVVRRRDRIGTRLLGIQRRKLAVTREPFANMLLVTGSFFGKFFFAPP
ncbi:MAG: hypothetical protein ACI9JM_001332 [Halioglobus sp.]|jgi:hypothetical protein